MTNTSGRRQRLADLRRDKEGRELRPRWRKSVEVEWNGNDGYRCDRYHADRAGQAL
jgi:hypothetical protein